MVSLDKVAIFWDFENCRPPSSLNGYLIVDRIRETIGAHGAIVLFKAYVEVDVECVNAKSHILQSELQSSGVSVTHCPHNGKKDVADKMIIVDMLAFAIDQRAPATVVLISGDRDFSYAVSILRLRGYKTIVIAPSVNSHVSLRVQASVLLDWQKVVLGVGTKIQGGQGKADVSDAQKFGSTLGLDGCPLVAAGRDTQETPPITIVVAHPSITSSPLTTQFNVASDASMGGSHSRDSSSLSSIEFCLDGGRTYQTQPEEKFRGDVGLDKKDLRGDCDSHSTRSSAVQPLEASFKRTASRFLPDQRSSDSAVFQAMNGPEDHDSPHGVIMMTEHEQGQTPGNVSEDQVAELFGPQAFHDWITAPQESYSLPSPSSSSSLSRSSTTLANFTPALGKSEAAEISAVSPKTRDKEFNTRRPTPPDSHVHSQTEEFSRSLTPRLAFCPQPSASFSSSSSTISPFALSGSNISSVESRAADLDYTSLIPHPVSPTQELPTVVTGAPQGISANGFEDTRFSVLLAHFRMQRAKDGSTRIRSSDVGSNMKKMDPLVYERAGTSRLKDYIELGRQVGVIISPGLDQFGDGWVEINPQLYNVATLTPVEGQSGASRVITPRRNATPMPPRKIPDIFIPLVTLIQQHSPQKRVLFSQLGGEIRQMYPTLYKRANVSNLGQYVVKAADANVVKVGDLGSAGRQWVELIDSVPHRRAHH